MSTNLQIALKNCLNYCQTSVSGKRDNKLILKKINVVATRNNVELEEYQSTIIRRRVKASGTNLI